MTEPVQQTSLAGRQKEAGKSGGHAVSVLSVKQEQRLFIGPRTFNTVAAESRLFEVVPNVF